MMRLFQQSLLAALILATALAACSAGPLGDQMPAAMGGLPSGTPARPAAPYQYPAVHDIPAPRSTEPLSEDAQVRLEKDLQATRDRQEAAEGLSPDGSKAGAAKKTAPVAGKKVVSPAKKPPADVKKQPADVIVVPPAGVATKP